MPDAATLSSGFGRRIDRRRHGFRLGAHARGRNRLTCWTGSDGQSGNTEHPNTCGATTVPNSCPRAVQQWLKDHEVKTLYVEPGSPWQNWFVENFHGKVV
jgi:hypothetical protein